MDNVFDYFETMDALSIVPAADETALPALFVSARTAPAGILTLPLLTVEGISFGLDKPIDNGAAAAAVVALLRQGNQTLARVAAQICAYDETDDQRAMSVVYFVSNLLTYINDGGGIGDRWTGAVATWTRRYGDCEDGAILIHALLLAAGVNPNRVRTACGKAMTTALTEIGHAWVMYRRLSDEEWIPLEWTWQPSPYDVEAGQIVRQIDKTDSYTRISYVLTHATFGAVDSVGYLSQLEVNRASGTLPLPALSVAARTGNHASGRLDLFVDPLGGLSITVEGRTGARASFSLPMLQITATATQQNVAHGVLTLPYFSVEARSGARGEVRLPALSAQGRCGHAARGALALPLLGILAAAGSENLASGNIPLPLLVIKATAKQGAVCNGRCDLPLLLLTARASQGPIARGRAPLPMLQIVAKAHTESVARGDLCLPPLEIRAHAVQAFPWSDPLQYDSERWS